MKRNDIINKENIELINLWISENRPKTWICKQFRCRPNTLDGKLETIGINYKGNKGGKGKKFPKRREISLYFNGNIFINSSNLRIRLIEEGLKEEKCEKCLNFLWEGNKIPLDLHHIDGNRFNNTLENLSILCKNCHAQTDNYGSKNRKNSIKELPIENKLIKESKRRSEESLARNSEFINLVLNSNIDFSRFGWVGKIAIILNKKPQKINKWMKKWMPGLYETSFKRK